jgi:transposase
MPASRKYPVELKERATRLALDARADVSTRRGAIARIAGQLGINPEALRGWVRLAEAGGDRSRLRGGAGQPEMEPVSDRERVVALEKQVRELKRANTILRQGGCRANRQGCRT